jgi:hypothetical protein
MLQVARYQPGQHFLAHEDAFPPNIALQKVRGLGRDVVRGVVHSTTTGMAQSKPP